MNLSIHPFPARMAPELALDTLRQESGAVRVLDPMSGSGTTLRHASALGHEAHGRDLDPLSVLMARVWTKHIDIKETERISSAVIHVARSVDPDAITLPWIDEDTETSSFVDFWFGVKQRSQLRCLAAVLMDPDRHLSSSMDPVVLDALKVALSRIIITKQQKASLARDTAHSRPHKVSTASEYDVLHGFSVSVKQVTKRLIALQCLGSVSVELGDARALDFRDDHFDVVLTSPPYLNAIDYMRGHKLALVWLGYRIEQLRDIRARSIGAEKAPGDGDVHSLEIMAAFGDISKLPQRQVRMIERYAVDLEVTLSETARVLKPGGRAIYVVGNSCLRGVFINNASALATAARISDLRIVDEVERELPQNRRYLPVRTDSALHKRMHTEIICHSKRRDVCSEQAVLFSQSLLMPAGAISAQCVSTGLATYGAFLRESDLESDCHGSVIDQRDLHFGTKLAGLDSEACLVEAMDKVGVEWYGGGWRYGGGEGRSVATVGVGGKGKLAHHKDGATDIQNRAVHLAVVVLKYSQPREFAGQFCGGVFGITMHGTDQHQQPRVYLAMQGTIDGDRGGCDPLDEGAHGRSLLVKGMGRDGVWQS